MYFFIWISLIYVEFKFLNLFFSKDIIMRIMLEIFKVKYLLIRVIIDCIEFFI